MFPILILSLSLAADPTPKIPIGKDTTFVDGPLDKEGYVEYDVALNRLFSKGVTPQNNANVLLWQAIGPMPERQRTPEAYFQAMGMAEPPDKGNYFIDWSAFLKTQKKLKQSQINKIDEATWVLPYEPWSAKKHPLAAAWLRRNDMPLSIAKQGIARSRYYNPLIPSPGGSLFGVYPPNIWSCRELAKALSMRAMLHLHQGELDAAWDDVLACQRLSRHVAQGATMVESLLGYAIDSGVAHRAAIQLILSDAATLEQLTHWLEDFNKLPNFPPFHEVVDRGERMAGLDLIQNRMRNPDELEMDIPKGMKIKNIDWTVAFKTSNALMDQAVAIVTLKEGQTSVDLAAITQKFKALQPKNEGLIPALQMFYSPKEWGTLIGQEWFQMTGPAIDKMFQSYLRTLQSDDILRIAITLAIHKKTTGNYPKQLAELKLTKEPIDCFTGKPLIYKKTANGYRLYSFGVNQKDDNGQSYGDKPRGDDITVTVPIPPIKE